MKQKNRITGTFTGTIDELLTHCKSIDVDAFYKEYLENQELEQGIHQFMDENDMSEDELIKFDKLQMIQHELDKLIDEGKVEIVGYNPLGDPIYKAV